MKKKTKIILLIIAIIIMAIAAFLLLYSLKPFPDDYESFNGLREDLTESLSNAGAAEREINGYFNEYKLNLNPLYGFMFKNSSLSLYLKSYQSEIIDTGTISQFEIGDTGIFFDFTFMIRPKAEYSLPFFHGDALKALPGVDGALYMDFYSFENTMDLDTFFGSNIVLIERAMKLAEPYWKHKGFGELTTHLDDYKSPYRFEILEPEKVAEDERAEYFKTVRECFNLYSTAYLNSLEAHEADIKIANAAVNAAEISGFVDILNEHDLAVRMGKMIFPEEDFDRYFLEGFWGVK